MFRTALAELEGRADASRADILASEELPALAALLRSRPTPTSIRRHATCSGSRAYAGWQGATARRTHGRGIRQPGDGR